MTTRTEKYCEKCGAELIRLPKPAEKIKIEVCNGFDSWTTILGQRFNTETGMRQFGIIVKCPNATRWNDCMNFVDEGSLHDSDLPELTKM